MPQDQLEFFQQHLDSTKGRHVYTVSEITCDIKIILKNTFGEIWVEGEVSNFKTYSSGHFYFSLKDKDAVLQAAIFHAASKDIKFKIEDGLKIICFGKIDVYAPRGEYKLIVEKIEPKGIGSLQLALEQLKQKLEKEGLFSPEHKRPIPYLPSKIGVVTSLSGAAIKDILKVLERRFSGAHIIISPAQVQGENAKEEIARSIKDLNRLNEGLPAKERIEVMIVGRGGGSIEDLWAFNEEIVARAIYNSKIPVISAVGHERDWTIADLVADARASTPSVAAEMVMPKKEDLNKQLERLFGGLKRAFPKRVLAFQESMDEYLYRLRINARHLLELNKECLDANIKKLAILNPIILIKQNKAKIADLANQIHVRTQYFIKLKLAGFDACIEKLSSLSPLGILSRGYSITFKLSSIESEMPGEVLEPNKPVGSGLPSDRQSHWAQQGTIVKDVESLQVGDNIRTKLRKGEILSKITQIK